MLSVLQCCLFWARQSSGIGVELNTAEVCTQTMYQYLSGVKVSSGLGCLKLSNQIVASIQAV